MTAHLLGRSKAPALIQSAIHEHGAKRVLWVALVALLRRKSPTQPRPPDAVALSSHLRRDIGLPPEPEAMDWWRML